MTAFDGSSDRNASFAMTAARTIPTAVSVAAAARLHLGFLDPSGTLGRRFGSLGMMIDGLATEVEMSCGAEERLEAPAAASHELPRVRRLLRQLQAATGKRQPVQVRIGEALPPHVGLGSGTQLALAMGRAFSELHGLELATPAIANLLDRGARSGIGIAGFDRGGVLVDGGPRPGSDAPPVLARLLFPERWRVILIQDPTRSGLHGDIEKEGLSRLPLFERARAAHVCHLVLMQILPALAESDFRPFAAGLTELQAIVGEYFAPAQGGVYTSPAVARLIHWLADRHEAGFGQSSWGPTAFAILPSEARAREVLSAASAAGAMDRSLVASIVAGRNDGARISRGSGAGTATGTAGSGSLQASSA
jgi:beta-RFAP synthase